ncbi:hypothetical protein CLAIMM_02682 [Cladophialophora immunda]|nr:hypothetical protein CLAIMM_02682 [Cladophialophora immunda]
MIMPIPEVNLLTAKAKQRRQKDPPSGISHVHGSGSSCLRISAAANRASQLPLALITPTFSDESSSSSQSSIAVRFSPASSSATSAHWHGRSHMETSMWAISRSATQRHGHGQQQHIDGF